MPKWPPWETRVFSTSRKRSRLMSCSASPTSRGPPACRGRGRTAGSRPPVTRTRLQTAEISVVSRRRWAEQTEELTVGHDEVDAVERRGSRRRSVWSAAQGPASAPDGSSARDVRLTMQTRSCAELTPNPSAGFGRRPARHCRRAGCPSRRPGYNSSTSGSARASPVDQQHIEAFASAIAPAQALAAGPPTPIARASWSGTSTPIRSTAAPGQGHAALVRLAVHHRTGWVHRRLGGAVEERDPGWPRASATSTTPTLEFDHRIEVVFLRKTARTAAGSPAPTLTSARPPACGRPTTPASC
jgi:hypothetical protein